MVFSVLEIFLLDFVLSEQILLLLFFPLDSLPNIYLLLLDKPESEISIATFIPYFSTFTLLAFVTSLSFSILDLKSFSS